MSGLGVGHSRFEHKSIICGERIARKRSRESKNLRRSDVQDVAHDVRLRGLGRARSGIYMPSTRLSAHQANEWLTCHILAVARHMKHWVAVACEVVDERVAESDAHTTSGCRDRTCSPLGVDKSSAC